MALHHHIIHHVKKVIHYVKEHKRIYTWLSIGIAAILIVTMFFIQYIWGSLEKKQAWSQEEKALLIFYQIDEVARKRRNTMDTLLSLLNTWNLEGIDSWVIMKNWNILGTWVFLETWNYLEILRNISQKQQEQFHALENTFFETKDIYKKYAIAKELIKIIDEQDAYLHDIGYKNTVEDTIFYQLKNQFIQIQ